MAAEQYDLQIFNNIDLNGTFKQSDLLSFVDLTFDVPDCTTSILFELKVPSDTAIDMGIFGPQTDNGGREFRGWSGDARREVLLATDVATPGYLAGAIHPGEWCITLGPTAFNSPEIRYCVEIALGEGERKLHVPTISKTRVLDKGEGWYRGDLHVHSEFSDGKYTLQELLAGARRRKLEFFFSTEHNTTAANNEWGKLHADDILIGRGQEVTTKNGHWNALGLEAGQWVEWRYRDEKNLKDSIKKVHESDGVAIINHPYDGGLRCDWLFEYLEDFDCLEVWNGKWKRSESCTRNIKAIAKWQELLVSGKKYIAVGASDCHNPGQPIGLPHTVVYATDLSVSALTAGLRKGRSYIAAEPTFILDLELGQGDYKSADIGQTIKLRGIWDLFAQVTIEGLDGAELFIISEGGVIERETIRGSNFRTRYALDAPHVEFVRLEVRHRKSGDMLALTNPIWVSPN